MKKLLSIIVIVCIAMPLSAQWSSNPSVNNIVYSNGETFSSLTATDEATGMTYIQWFVLSSSGMRPMMQLYNNQGVAQWQENGIIISTNQNSSALYGTALEVSSDGCALVAFADERNGDMNPFIYKISQTGEFLWGDNGIQLSNLEAYRIYVYPCNDGSAWAAWYGETCYMRHINADGTTDPIITIENDSDFGHVICDDNNNAIMAYFHQTGGTFMWPDREVKVCKYSTSGAQIWLAATLIQSYSYNFSTELQLVSDGLGGGYVATKPVIDNTHQAVIGHFNSNGTVTTPMTGVLASIESSAYNYYPTISVDPTTNNCIMFFRRSNVDENTYQLKGQCFTATGSRLWTNTGASLSGYNDYVYPITSASVPTGGAVLIYEFGNANNQSTIKAMRVDADGEFVWDNESVYLCNLASVKSTSHVCSGFHNGQVIYSWNDARTPQGLYAQNLKLDGTLGPIQISTISGDANGDGSVNVSDINTVISYINEDEPEDFIFDNADVNGDNAIDIRDIVLIVNIIMQ